MERIIGDIHGIILIIIITILILLCVYPDLLSGWGKDDKNEGGVR